MWQDIKNIYHFIRAVIANILYGFPSKKIKVIGVTGTDGKTTTSNLIYHILKSAGRKTSIISTVYAQIGDEIHDTGFHITTPSMFVVQKFIKQAVNNGDEFFVLEVTSHSLHQHRVLGVKFDVGMITNVSHEHLDYHKTYENYVKAKAILLQNANYSLINRDDKSYELLSQILKRDFATYGLEQKADFQFDISEKINLPLAQFNKYNFLAAYGVCKHLGLSDEEIFTGMKTYVLPPGRMEMVYDKDFKVIVDFAHTPKAIHEALKSIRAQYVTQGNLIHVFSSASKRDESKRPFMGEESAAFADFVILTEEDCRDEDPYKINREIAAGLLKKDFKEVKPEEFGKESKTYTVLVDRGDAVKKALAIVKKGDVVVLTGKGHEMSLCRGNTEYPWNDKEAVLNILNK